MMMSCAAMLTAVLAAAPAPAARAVLLPIRLPDTASAELKQASVGVERLLVQALARHASFQLVSRQEMMALLGSAAQDQLMGCDAETCAAEIADALNADYVIISQLAAVDGTYSLLVTLVDRAKAVALRRASVKARDMDALLGSVDQVARQLAQGSQASLEDPRLAERLGTNAAGVAALKDAVKAHPDADLSQVWTDVVIAHNGESDRLALTEGLLVLGAVGTVVVGTVFSTSVGSWAGWVQGQTQPSLSPDAPDPVNANGTYNFPWLAVLLSWAAGSVITVGMVSWVGALGVVAVVDWLDLGTLPVSKQGCCRDEVRLRAAAAPGWQRRVAPYLATAAGGLALLTWFISAAAATVVLYPLYTLQGKGGLPSVPWGPTVQVPRNAYLGFNGLQLAAGYPLFILGYPTLAAAAFAAAVALIATERSTLVE